MPIYEYRCRNGHTFEVSQSMADDPVTSCEECGAPVERVFHPVAVHFKGSGFYTTDYARKGAKAAESDGGGGKNSVDSKPEKSAKDKKPDKSAPKSEHASLDVQITSKVQVLLDRLSITLRQPA